MRKRLASTLLLGLLVGLLGVATSPDAGADSVNLIWLSSGTSVSVVSPGASDTLQVILIHDSVPLISDTILVGITTLSGDPLWITAAANTPPSGASAVSFAITNDPPFGSQVGAFGGLSLGQINPGVYTVGTITVTAGAGSSVIAPFQRPEIDDWLDTSGYNTIVPTLNTARIGCLGGPGTGCAPGDPITPEPASAALLGMGLAVLATWRRAAERHAPPETPKARRADQLTGLRDSW